MHFEPELIEELNLLKRFSFSGDEDLDIGQSPDHAAAAAAGRLYAKGLITRVDGGRLTERGQQAVDGMHQLFSLLSPPLEPI